MKIIPFDSRHDFVDGDVSVAGNDMPRCAAHLVFDDVRLVLQNLDTRAGCRVHHLERDREAAAVVDAELGDNEGNVGGTDSARADVDLRQVHEWNCTRPRVWD